MGFPGYFLIVSDFVKWCKHNGEIQTPCVDGIVSYLPSQIKEKGGHLEVAQWMEQFISFATPTELHEVVPSVLVLCQSKNSTTRKSAENVLRIISESAGSNVVSEAFGQLHGVIARTLKPIVDRAIEDAIASGITDDAELHKIMVNLPAYKALYRRIDREAGYEADDILPRIFSSRCSYCGILGTCHDLWYFK